MNPDVVYGKTAKGLEEMAARTYKLPARVRTLLIMIDGKTSAGQFVSRAASPEDAASHIAVLLEGGFIEPKALGPSQAAAKNIQPAGVDVLEQARKFMVTSMTAALGPDADHFTMKIEAARSLDALAQLAPTYIEVIRAGGGGRKAQAFRDGLLQYGVTREVAETPAPDTTAAQLADDARRLANAKRTITEFLLDTLGADANRFTAKVESVATIPELRQLAAGHLEVIRAAAGARRAEDFRQRIIDALNS